LTIQVALMTKYGTTKRTLMTCSSKTVQKSQDGQPKSKTKTDPLMKSC